MIKRFREINQVGAFKKCCSGGVELSELSVIYGLNMYGKSTISDILRSLEKDDPTIITKRKSIPCDTRDPSQRVKLTCKINNSEEEIAFRSNTWSKPSSFTNKLMIFDDRFVEDNVFTGFSITRENKENFTDFILGEENARIGRAIETLRSDSRQTTYDMNQLKKLIEDSLPKGIGLPDFIALKIDESDKELKSEKEQKEAELSKLQQNKDNLDGILETSLPTGIKQDDSVPEFLKSVNDLLSREMKEANAKAKERVQEHIKEHFKNHDDKEEQWIKKGFSDYLKQSPDAICPFCGQEILDHNLLDIYEEHFNAEMIAFLNQIQQDMIQAENDLETMVERLDFEKTFTRNELYMEQWKNIIGEKGFSNRCQRMADSSKCLVKEYEKISSAFVQHQEPIKMKLDEKRKSLGVSIAVLDFSQLESSIANYHCQVSEYNGIVDEVNKEVENYKNGLDEKTLEESITKKTNEVGAIELKQLRIHLEKTCNDYSSMEAKSKELWEAIVKKEKDLDAQKSVFLSEYFDTVNKFFKMYGSEGFRISKVDERYGNKPVVGIQVQYFDENISIENISYLFSCSDRRALALALFWANVFRRVENGDEVILVLDDPVTSFDDNRITSSVMQIVGAIDKLDQVIILTHYDNFVRRFIDLRNLPKLKILNITRDSASSLLEVADRERFLRDNHFKQYLRIEEFINRDTNEDVSEQLRRFLEYETESRFRMQIRENGIRNDKFGDFLLELEDKGIISSDIYNSLNQYREFLNPDHHQYTDMGIEDKRNFTKKLINFIYYELKPK